MNIFTPVNAFCYDCLQLGIQRTVEHNERQGIVIDQHGVCWRQCAACIEAENKRKAA